MKKVLLVMEYDIDETVEGPPIVEQITGNLLIADEGGARPKQMHVLTDLPAMGVLSVIEKAAQ